MERKRLKDKKVRVRGASASIADDEMTNKALKVLDGVLASEEEEYNYGLPAGNNIYDLRVN